MAKTICVPGQRICSSSDKYIAGYGTYERQNYIYASLAGAIKLVPKESLFIVEVETDKGQNTVPLPGDVVTAQVVSINQMMARCMIKCIGDTVLTRPFRANLKKEDVRATEKDKIEMVKSFRPGDIILARVLPLTELNAYHLSTAENELGVVIALSEAGIAMVPISWSEMQCPKTYNKEFRKVAKIVPESIVVD